MMINWYRDSSTGTANIAHIIIGIWLHAEAKAATMSVHMEFKFKFTLHPQGTKRRLVTIQVCKSIIQWKASPTYMNPNCNFTTIIVPIYRVRLSSVLKENGRLYVTFGTCHIYDNYFKTIKITLNCRVLKPFLSIYRFLTSRQNSLVFHSFVPFKYI